MSRTGWLGMWFLLALMVIVTFVFEAFPESPRLNPDTSLPLTAPLVRGQDMELTPQEAKLFHGARVLKRFYQIAGNAVVITVVDGTENRNAVHDPLFCFRGAGWSIAGESRIPVNRGSIRLVQLSKGDETTRVACWYSNGKRQYTSPIEFWARSFLRRASFRLLEKESLLVVVQQMDPSHGSLIRALQYFPHLNML